MSAPTLFLLDTNIISQMMKDGHGIAAQRGRALLVDMPSARVVTSVVVQCELLFGLAKFGSLRLRKAYALQMEQLDVLPVDEAVSAHYAQLRAYLERQGTPIGANDTLIAAQALALGATLVSGDTEFARVPGLQVQNWLKPS